MAGLGILILMLAACHFGVWSAREKDSRPRLSLLIDRIIIVSCTGRVSHSLEFSAIHQA